MVNDDTVKLLKECNAGVKTAVASIDEVLGQTKSEALKTLLEESKARHESLGDKTHTLLNEYKDSEKDPNPIAKAMSWLKINAKLALNASDAEVADLMFDGCNMGVKSLFKYLNQYKGANEASKDITNSLIEEEEKLRKDLVKYL